MGSWSCAESNRSEAYKTGERVSPPKAALTGRKETVALCDLKSSLVPNLSQAGPGLRKLLISQEGLFLNGHDRCDKEEQRKN